MHHLDQGRETTGPWITAGVRTDVLTCSPKTKADKTRAIGILRWHRAGFRRFLDGIDAGAAGISSLHSEVEISLRIVRLFIETPRGGADFHSIRMSSRILRMPACWIALAAPPTALMRSRSARPTADG